MRGQITSNEKEQKRLMILNKVCRGELTAAAAADLLGRSLRQTRREVERRRRDVVAINLNLLRRSWYFDYLK